MPSRKSRMPLKAEMNFIPFIDIVLVLLIVFMIAAPELTQGVHVDLPKVTAQPIEQTTQNNWVLSINEDRNLFLDRNAGSRAARQKTNIEAVANAVKNQTEATPDLRLFLRADRSIPYGEVMDVLSLLQQEGLQQVGLITETDF